MSSEFSVLTDEFKDELGAITSMMSATSDPKIASPKTRIAAANAATLLLAATFEEFVREMARTYARYVVAQTALPKIVHEKMASTVWRRSLENLSKLQFERSEDSFVKEALFSDALTRFQDVYAFCRGDLTKDIYEHLIYNANNMRPGEINSLFKVSSFGDICSAICSKEPILQAFAEIEAGKAHGQLIKDLNSFFERRNQVAHSIGVMRSGGLESVREVMLIGRSA